jgi:hypothetical protein
VNTATPQPTSSPRPTDTPIVINAGTGITVTGAYTVSVITITPQPTPTLVNTATPQPTATPQTIPTASSWLTGTLSSGYVPRATGSITLTSGSMQDNGTRVGIGTAPDSVAKLNVAGSVLVNGLTIQAGSGTGAIYSNGYSGPSMGMSAQNLSTFASTGLTVDPAGGVVVSSSNGGSATVTSSGPIISTDHVSQLLPFAQYVGYTANATTMTWTVNGSLTIQRWVQAYYISGTNNGTNYWSIYLDRIDTGATLASYSTSAASANTWTVYDSGALSISVTQSMKMLYLYIIKSGSPGTLYLASPSIYAY